MRKVVNMTCSFKMTWSNMSSVFLAIVLTSAKLIHSSGIGIYSYSLTNRDNHIVKITLEIFEDQVGYFEVESGQRLYKI